jgi:hypothetical protein
MPRKAYLEFRNDQKGVPQPAIIYDEYWTDYRTQKHHSPTHGPYDISHYVGPDGEVTQSFAALTREYLPLQKRQNDDKDREEREYQMAPRAATGFLASDNKFFATAEECDFYEQSLELGKRIQNATGAVRQIVQEHTPVQDFLNQIPDMLLSFIKSNEDVIYEYIRSKRVLNAPTAEALPVSGQASDDTQAIDPSLRSSSDSEMDTSSTSEDDTSRTGEKSSSKKSKSRG